MNDFPGKKKKEAKKNYRKLWKFWNLREIFCESKLRWSWNLFIGRSKNQAMLFSLQQNFEKWRFFAVQFFRFFRRFRTPWNFNTKSRWHFVRGKLRRRRSVVRWSPKLSRKHWFLFGGGGSLHPKSYLVTSWWLNQPIWQNFGQIASFPLVDVKRKNVSFRLVCQGANLRHPPKV